MRCPECGTNLFERTERNSEGTVEKTFHCYNCGVVQIPDTAEPTPLVNYGHGFAKATGLRILNLFISLLIFLVVGGVVYFVLGRVFTPILFGLGWMQIQQPPGEFAHPLYYVYQILVND